MPVFCVFSLSVLLCSKNFNIYRRESLFFLPTKWFQYQFWSTIIMWTKKLLTEKIFITRIYTAQRAIQSKKMRLVLTHPNFFRLRSNYEVSFSNHQKCHSILCVHFALMFDLILTFKYIFSLKMKMERELKMKNFRTQERERENLSEREKSNAVIFLTRIFCAGLYEKKLKKLLKCR